MTVYIHYLDGRVEAAENVKAIRLERESGIKFLVFEGCEGKPSFDDWGEVYNDKKVDSADIEYIVWR